jgi:hypothetical protein
MRLLALLVGWASARHGTWFDFDAEDLTCTWVHGTKKYLCDYQNLTQIPTDIPADTVVLGLSRNIIEHVPANAFKDLHDLRIVDLSGNYLKTISTSAFNSTSKIEILDLHNNTLAAGLEDTIFLPLNKLQYLHMHQNKLTTLLTSANKSLLTHLPALTYLDLSENRLTTVPSTVFKAVNGTTAFNPKLHTINLRRNQIQYIEPLTFDANTVLQSIDLYANGIEEETGGTYKHLEDVELQYLAQGKDEFSTVTKDEDGELPWRRGDCGVCRDGEPAKQCFDLRKLYGVNTWDYKLSRDIIGTYSVNATPVDACVDRCSVAGRCTETTLINCWSPDDAKCKRLEDIVGG